MTPTRRTLLAGGGALLVTGCSNLVGPQPPALYICAPKTTWDPDLPRVDRQLVVAVPESSQALGTARIALSRTHTTIDYFAAAAWTDTAPVMIQGLLVESFENTGRIAAVGRDLAGLRADFILTSDLRDFEARYYEGTETPPKILVRIEAKLVRMPDRAIIGSYPASAEAVAAAKDLDSIVEAFNEALGRAIKHLGQWTLRTMAAG